MARSIAAGVIACLINSFVIAVLYVVIADTEAMRDGDVRIIDESGEDYLLAADRFVAIDAPTAVQASLLLKAS